MKKFRTGILLLIITGVMGLMLTAGAQNAEAGILEYYRGYRAGFEKGLLEGFDKGFPEGQLIGASDQYQQGIQDGRQLIFEKYQDYSYGQPLNPWEENLELIQWAESENGEDNRGLLNRDWTYKDGYANGYGRGHDRGYKQGLRQGKLEDQPTAYNKGLKEGQAEVLAKLFTNPDGSIMNGKDKYRRAHLMLSERKSKLAQLYFNAVIIDHHTDLELLAGAIYFLADLQYSRRQYMDAALLFKRYLRIPPDIIDLEQGMYRMGVTYEKLRVGGFLGIGSLPFYHEAVDAYRGYLSQFSSHRRAPEVTYRLGRCLEKAGKKDQAIQVYQLLIEQYGFSQFKAKAYLRLKILSR